MEDKDTGLLLPKQDIALFRVWFKEMTHLLGLNVLYRAPRESKQYDQYGELDANYYEPIVVGAIYNEHVDQKTMKKLGWNAELSESTTVIHVPYDTPKLQAGALFIVPSGLDNTEGRVFRVIRMTYSPIYPSSIACELGPVLKNEFEKRQLHDFEHTNFNLLKDEVEDE